MIGAEMLFSLKAKVWEFSQFIFGADDRKYQIYRRGTGIDYLKDSDRRILDFGCATGNMAPAFLDCDYLGVDVDKTLIDFASRKYANNRNLKFITSNDFKDKYNGVKWPIVLLANTAHHLDDVEFSSVISLLRGCLLPGGTICFIEPVTTGQESQLLRFIMAMDKGRFHRTASSYKTYFEVLGCCVDHVEYQPEGLGRFFPVPTGVIMRVRPKSEKLMN